MSHFYPRPPIAPQYGVLCGRLSPVGDTPAGLFYLRPPIAPQYGVLCGRLSPVGDTPAAHFFMHLLQMSSN